MLKRKLTEVAVDAFTEYLNEKLNTLKQLDLDKDGRKDVDQLAEIVGRCGLITKDVLSTTDFSKIGSGLEQIINGTTMIRNALNKEQLSILTRELSEGAAKIGELAKLSIDYAKEQRSE
jgi:hypothetical protein